jgi:hypothetical protein
MRLPWPAQHYERTCADCGGAWRVPRQFARSRVQSIFNFGNFNSNAAGRSLKKAELDRQIRPSMEIGQQSEAFRKCPGCGSVHYSQRPVRS